MRIVSLNAWGGKVWPALPDWIAAEVPDILCLQEVTRAPVPSPDWLVYEDDFRRLDQRADLFADVSKCLPRHQGLFAPAARGVMRDGQGREVASEHGIAAWIAPHLAVTEYRSVFVHGGFRADGWGPEPVPRTMQVLRIADPAAPGTLVVAHLHGLRDPAGKGDTPAREAQARAIRAALEDFARPGEPLVLAGDLNILPGSATFAFLAGIGLSDLVTGRGHDDTRTVLYDKPVRFADYMLVTPGVPVARFDLPAEPVLSDHRAMVLSLDWPLGRS
ncbi:endonuclease/exonuclease/phosphatase family protein [Rhodobacterales bacterium HKCCE2091]|nr:endonuclease/exonuclease/phosphatase family protein [Rhodobacterales bacterium HKCCE2091]